MKFRFVSLLFFFAILGFNCLTSEEVAEDFMFYTLLSTPQPGYALLKILDTEKVEKINKGYVGFDVDIFNNRITASDARLKLQLNSDKPLVYQDVSLEKWPEQNYFKTSNYLSSTSGGAFSELEYYELNVTY